jgi:cyclophilin family peptidyl-prolyl cis-trans isomerase/HEAT repeat protein
MKRFLFILLIAILHVACKEKNSGANKFSDPVIQKIYDLADRRLSDSLYQYFSSENAVYRKEAVLAFASIQDSTAADKIGKILMMDSDTSVRKAAAYSLGQNPSSHCERILLGALVKDKKGSAFKEILEAYGKTTKHWRPAQLDIHDSIESPAIAWSLYRAGFRGMADSTVNDIAANLLDSHYNEEARLGAAHFFARGAKNYSRSSAALIKSAKEDKSDDVRMASAFALRKIKTDSSLTALKQISSDDKDYRVRVNAVRALQAFPFEKVKENLFSALTDKNVNVGIAASEVMKAIVPKDAWMSVANSVARINNARIQANLYEAALSVSDNKTLIEEIKSAYDNSKDNYQKAALLTSLQQSVSASDFIAEQLFKTDVFVIRSSAASALTSINSKKTFDPKLKTKFADLYRKAMETGDPAVIGTIAGTLADSALGYRSVIKDFTFLYDAKKKLSLPKDNEALQPLEAAIAHFEKKKISSPVKNEFNHSIDWELIKKIPTNQIAVIKTLKGNITLRLLVEDAPGSVANFVTLVSQHYFDQKFFHRVVPNFVVQAGCNRGDGWGSEDYSIRSEFTPRKYKTGSVGMASAGKDTEGTQWFITHSPTPHLDGRYTIFAEVTDGLEVVHRIEVGDQILKVELKDFNVDKK